MTNSNRFGLAHTKSLTDSLLLHMNSSHKTVLYYTFIETTYSLIIQKNPICTLTFAISCAYQTQPFLALRNQLISSSSPFNTDELLSRDNSSQNNLTLPTPSIYDTDFLSEHNSLTKMNDNPFSKQIINAPQSNPPIDR